MSNNSVDGGEYNSVVVDENNIEAPDTPAHSFDGGKRTKNGMKSKKSKKNRKSKKLSKSKKNRKSRKK